MKPSTALALRSAANRRPTSARALYSREFTVAVRTSCFAARRKRASGSAGGSYVQGARNGARIDAAFAASASVKPALTSASSPSR